MTHPESTTPVGRYRRYSVTAEQVAEAMAALGGRIYLDVLIRADERDGVPADVAERLRISDYDDARRRLIDAIGSGIFPSVEEEDR